MIKKVIILSTKSALVVLKNSVAIIKCRGVFVENNFFFLKLTLPTFIIRDFWCDMDYF